MKRVLCLFGRHAPELTLSPDTYPVSRQWVCRRRGCRWARRQP